MKAFQKSGPGFDPLLKSLRKLVKQDVLVGIPAAAGDQPGTAVSLALIGYIQETGSPANNIPARPFLAPGVSDARDDIAAQMRKGALAAIKGDAAGIEAALNAAGLIAQSAVKAKITSNISPELSERTIEARKRRGVTRTNTLVDTGALLNSITYVVRSKSSDG